MGETAADPRIPNQATGPFAARLRELRDEARPAYVAGVKQALREEWERISRYQIDHINEVTGLDVGALLTTTVDTTVGEFTRRALDRAQAPTDDRAGFAVFALGGYGRGELSPSSDIDLLILDCDRGASAPWMIDTSRELQMLLWDTGFRLGASMRQPSELERILGNDFVTATAVLEQRLVFGDPAAEQVLDDIRARFRRRRAKPFLRYKLAELQERRADLTRGMFMLEPDLKTDPGGLRDVQLLRNIGYILFGSRNLHALRELDVVGWSDVHELFAANDHYLGLRALLHFHHGRSQDVLRLTDQLWLADLLGYTTGGRLMAVEHMMRLHYRKTLHVHQMVDLVVDRLHALGHLGRRRILVKSRRPLCEGFAVIDGRVYLADREIWHEPDVALRIVEACRLTQRRGYRLSLELQREIAARSFLFQAASVREDRRIARQMLEIFGDLGRVRPIIEDLHWSGLLGAYLPEFGRLTCHMQFNSYHQYTVDQHTLIAIGYIDDAAAGRGVQPTLVRRLVASLPRPDLLMFALLLHDMGKFMGSGHVKRGALMVQDIAERLGLDEHEQDVIHFLVDQHVVLSDATRSRDVHDPALLSALANDIGDQERLDLLYCLTWADASAVGDGVFTGWQQAILDELYEAVSDQLRWLTGEGAVSRPQQVRDELAAAGLGEAEIDAFLKRIDDGYAYQADRQEITTHVRLLARVAAGEVPFEAERDDRGLRLLLALPDRTRLLAEVAALLTGHGMGVVEARSWTTTDGHCLLSLRLTDGSASPLSDGAEHERLAEDLAQLAAGNLDPEAMVTRQIRRIRTRGPADSGYAEIDVSIDQDSCDDATVLDVMVKDRPGLLYTVCAAVADCDCTIGYAAITTYGDIARDAFYVRHQHHKLPGGLAVRLRDLVRERLARRRHDDPTTSEGVITI